jgi:hypothetical protein
MRQLKNAVQMDWAAVSFCKENKYIRKTAQLTSAIACDDIIES